MNAEYSANATNENARQLQNTLYLAAKENPKCKFHALYDKVFRKDILQEAWIRVKANRGSAGVDGQTIEFIVREIGEELFIEEIRQQLMNGEYRPGQTERNSKTGRKDTSLRYPNSPGPDCSDGNQHGDRRLFEADFKDCSYGFRPKRSAHQAIRFKHHYGSRPHDDRLPLSVEVTGQYNAATGDCLN
ncbi:hypothetical protein [Paenibacillus sedimenti]|uniref:Group II intron reverse transcriptase/maturase n=1 Tax=Paenibacillus sedimenti TaxID=2770274 RepID=A0A926KVC0_9BACL|nr:hypothetical protein [Paenibacillus sedimenti]MBD0384705.1 hypothetical protein [Paenibacillus sedimenti]